MTKVQIVSILKPHQWMTLASGVLVAGAVYALLIHPSLGSISEFPELRSAQQSAQDDLSRLRRSLQGARQQIDEGRAALAGLGGGPPPAGQKDLQIAQVTELADRCGVKIDQFAPIDTVEHPDHLAFMVEFTGQGRFVDIQRLFKLIESSASFVDVTNFAVNVARPGAETECTVSWSCRIHGIRAELTAKRPSGSGTAPRPADGGTAPAGEQSSGRRRGLLGLLAARWWGDRAQADAGGAR